MGNFITDTIDSASNALSNNFVSNAINDVGDYLSDRTGLHGLSLEYGLSNVSWTWDLGIQIPDVPEMINDNRVQTLLDPNHSIPVVYGETEIAGNIVFYDTTGTDGKYLDVVVAVAEGEIDGFYEVYMNDDPIPLFSSATALASSSVTEAPITSVHNSFYNGYVEAYFYVGTDAQAANSQLMASYPPGTFTVPLIGVTLDFNGWSTNHKLAGTAYAYFRLTYNKDKFSGSIPQFKFKVKGRKVYDPRTSTTVYSTNPAICLRDYLINTTFGKALPATSLSNQSIIDAANDCDTLVAGFDVLGSPVNYKAYEVGAIVDTARPVKDNVSYFLQAMNAMLPYYDGTYYLSIMQAGDAVTTFEESDIIGGITVSSTDKNSRFNKVMVSFPDKDRHYKIGEAPFENATYFAQDNDQTLEKRITVPFVTYYPRAADLAEMTMNLSRVANVISFTTTMEALKAVPGDIVGITYATFGWSAKEFRLQKISIRSDGLCDVSMVEHNDAFYSLTAKNEQPSAGYAMIQPAYISVAPTIATTLCDNTTALVSVDGLVYPRIYVSWTNNDNYPLAYHVYLKKASDVSFTKVGYVSSTDALSFYIPNVEWGVQYNVGVSVLNGAGYESSVTQSSITVPNPIADAIYDYPDVTGLELVGLGTNQGQGNSTSFTGKDIKLQWRLSSSNVTFEVGSTESEAMGATGGVLPFTLKGYRIEVYHPLDLLPRQEYFVTQPNFVYSLDKNIEDGEGTPSRTVTFKVYAVGQVAGTGISGESEVAAKITVTNPAPSTLTSLSLRPIFKTLILDFDIPSDADFKGVLIWLGTSTGFTRDATTLITPTTGTTGTKHIIDKLPNGTPLSSGTAYYVVVQPFDEFGLEGTESIELTTTTLSVDGQYDIAYQSIQTANIGLAQITNALVSDMAVDKLTSGDFTGKYINITTGGNIRSGQTAYDTGTGFWIGDVAGTPKFSIGNSAGDKVTWDGTTLTMTGDLSLDANNYWKKSNNTFKVGGSSNYMDWDGSTLNIAGNITASNIMGSSFYTSGTYLATATTGAETTITVGDTTNFATSGSGYFIDTSNNNDAFTWTGKTATTLTGCSGVLAHNAGAIVVGTPASGTLKAIVTSSLNNEQYFYGDRGDGTVERLATIGITTDGVDYYIGSFGSVNSTRVALTAVNDSATANLAYITSGVYATGTIGVQASGTSYGVTGSSPNGVGVFGESTYGYGMYASLGTNSVSPLRLGHSSVTNAPTHSANRGSLWVTADGILYINTTTPATSGTTWQKVGAQ